MKKNNKKGFTLIEIIITLGLILLITGVAIGSFVGISKQKKKEEWALVKGQIETAAEQYFSSNKYLFENIDTNSGVYAYITVGELVKENYIKRVVNPMDNKSLPYCSEIKVTFKNGKFTGMYTGEKTSNTESDCKYTGGTTTIRTPDGPNGNIVYYKVKDNGLGAETSVDKITGWFNSVSLDENKGLMVCVNLTSGSNNIKSALLNDGTKMTKYGKNYCIIAEQGKHENKIFTLKDSLNRTLILSTNYNVDSVKPVCETSATVNSNPYNGEWTKDTVNVVSNCNDVTSGCTSKSSTKQQTDSVSSSRGKSISGIENFSDNAGNTSNNCPTVLVKVDKTKPTGGITISKKDTWYSKNVSLAFEASDNLSGLSSYDFDGVNQITTDEVGNTTWNRNNNNYTLSGNYTDENRTKTLTARICDVAGNCDDKNDKYTLYQQCSSTTNNGDVINKGTCNTCGATTTTATQPTIDNNLGVACSKTVTVSCTPSCTATSVVKSYCNDSGHHTMEQTGTNCCSSDVEQDCGVKAIQLTLNNNDAESGNPIGMGGRGPGSTKGGRIFNRPKDGNTTGAHTWNYSASDNRDMDVTVGWNSGNKNISYAGASCMNVGDFPRRFKYKVQWSDNTWSDYRYVSMPSNETSNTDTKFTGRKTSLTVTLREDTSKIVLRYGCSNDDNINVNGCGSYTGSTPNVTTHTYYIEYGSIKSNTVTLYTKYFANCVH